ncbi:MAG: sulfatase family protein [Roseibacillus sp.]
MKFLLVLLSTITLRAESQPNILFLFADDLGRYASAYSDPKSPSPNDIVSTPIFDQVAKEGMLATNMFVSAPSCTPCRASLVSGRHFFRNGSCAQLHHKWHGPDEKDPWMQEVTGYAKTLQAAGYHIGFSQKEHLKNSPLGPQFRSAGSKQNQYSQFVSAAEDPKKAHQQLLAEVRSNFQEFLAARDEKEPFLYHFHPTNPHRKWVAGSGKKLWDLDPDSLAGIMPPFLPDVPVVREDLADYLGEGMAFDAYCEVILEELEKTGESKNTIVIISGDHGAPGFPRGKTNVYDFGARVLFAIRWPEKIKAAQIIETPLSLLDIAPTLLAAARVEPKDELDGQNLLPALVDGKTAALRGWALIGREAHVAEARIGNFPYPTRALRTSDHLYILNLKPERHPGGDIYSLLHDKPAKFENLESNTRYTYPDIDAGPTKAWMVVNRHNPEFTRHWELGFGTRPAVELYDLKSDPHQINNLAGEPAMKIILEKLHKKLMAELEAKGDPRLNGDQFDRPPYKKELSNFSL